MLSLGGQARHALWDAAARVTVDEREQTNPWSVEAVAVEGTGKKSSSNVHEKVGGGGERGGAPSVC